MKEKLYNFNKLQINNNINEDIKKTLNYIHQNNKIDDTFKVSYNINNINEIKYKNHNNKLILREGNYYYIYILKNEKEIFLDEKNNKLNIIGSKSNPLRGIEKFNNIIIEHKINYNTYNNIEIIGILYLYEPFEKNIKINNYYVIDIIYYNNLFIKRENYKLNYLFYNLEYYLNNKKNDIEKIYDYYTNIKPYIFIKKENINNKIENTLTILESRFNIKNVILNLTLENNAINKIYNISNNIILLLDKILISSYDLSLKMNNSIDNKKTIISCISNEKFKDKHNLSCSDYVNKKICKHNNIIIEDSELVLKLKNKGLNKLSALSECCDCGGGIKKLLSNINPNNLDNNVYNYLLEDLNNILIIKNALIKDLNKLKDNINYTNDKFKYCIEK